jgi:hypothetical protein
MILVATDPTKAAPGTIRALFGTEMPDNATHGSDSPDAAWAEMALFFPEMAARLDAGYAASVRPAAAIASRPALAPRQVDMVASDPDLVLIKKPIATEPEIVHVQQPGPPELEALPIGATSPRVLSTAHDVDSGQEPEIMQSVADKTLPPPVPRPVPRPMPRQVPPHTTQATPCAAAAVAVAAAVAPYGPPTTAMPRPVPRPVALK